jgi:hypothetical protein
MQLRARTMELRARTMQLRARTMELRARTMEFRARTMELRARMMELRTRMMELRTRTMELRARTMEFRTRTMELRARTMELRARTMEFRTRTMELRARTMGVGHVSPVRKPHPPKRRRTGVPPVPRPSLACPKSPTGTLSPASLSQLPPQNSHKTATSEILWIRGTLEHRDFCAPLTFAQPSVHSIHEILSRRRHPNDQHS